MFFSPELRKWKDKKQMTYPQQSRTQILIAQLSLASLLGLQGVSSFIINPEHGAFHVITGHKQRAGTLCNTAAWGTSSSTAPGLSLKFLGAENFSHTAECPHSSGVTFCTSKNQKSSLAWLGSNEDKTAGWKIP